MPVFGSPCKPKSRPVADKPPPVPNTGEPFHLYKKGNTVRGVTLSGQKEYRLQVAGDTKGIPLVDSPKNDEPYKVPSKVYVHVEKEKEDRTMHVKGATPLTSTINMNKTGGSTFSPSRSTSFSTGQQQQQGGGIKGWANWSRFSSFASFTAASSALAATLASTKSFNSPKKRGGGGESGFLSPDQTLGSERERLYAVHSATQRILSQSGFHSIANSRTLRRLGRMLSIVDSLSPLAPTPGKDFSSPALLADVGGGNISKKLQFNKGKQQQQQQQYHDADEEEIVTARDDNVDQDQNNIDDKDIDNNNIYNLETNSGVRGEGEQDNDNEDGSVLLGSVASGNNSPRGSLSSGANYNRRSSAASVTSGTSTANRSGTAGSTTQGVPVGQSKPAEWSPDQVQKYPVRKHSGKKSKAIPHYASGTLTKASTAAVASRVAAVEEDNKSINSKSSRASKGSKASKASKSSEVAAVKAKSNSSTDEQKGSDKTDNTATTTPISTTTTTTSSKNKNVAQETSPSAEESDLMPPTDDLEAMYNVTHTTLEECSSSTNNGNKNQVPSPTAAAAAASSSSSSYNLARAVSPTLSAASNNAKPVILNKSMVAVSQRMSPVGHSNSDGIVPPAPSVLAGNGGGGGGGYGMTRRDSNASQSPSNSGKQHGTNTNNSNNSSSSSNNNSSAMAAAAKHQPRPVPTLLKEPQVYRGASDAGPSNSPDSRNEKLAQIRSKLAISAKQAAAKSADKKLSASSTAALSSPSDTDRKMVFKSRAVQL